MMPSTSSQVIQKEIHMLYVYRLCVVHIYTEYTVYYTHICREGIIKYK